MESNLIEYLEKAEGKVFHYNRGESDLTSPLGVYKHAWPKAEIWNYVDSITTDLNLPEDTSDYDAEDVEVLNSKMNYGKVIELVSDFYDDYLKSAHLELFPSACQVTVFSLYVNSPRNMWRSVQQALNQFHLNHFIEFKVQTVDGLYGGSTKAGLELIKGEDIMQGYLFEAYILSNMKTQYAKLVAKNPDKFLKYLNGWNNRMNVLQKMS